MRCLLRRSRSTDNPGVHTDGGGSWATKICQLQALCSPTFCLCEHMSVPCQQSDKLLCQVLHLCKGQRPWLWQKMACHDLREGWDHPYSGHFFDRKAQCTLFWSYVRRIHHTVVASSAKKSVVYMCYQGLNLGMRVGLGHLHEEQDPSELVLVC
jgi:hypothetical protein